MAAHACARIQHGCEQGCGPFPWGRRDPFPTQSFSSIISDNDVNFAVCIDVCIRSGGVQRLLSCHCVTFGSLICNRIHQQPDFVIDCAVTIMMHAPAHSSTFSLPVKATQVWILVLPNLHLLRTSVGCLHLKASGVCTECAEVVCM